MRRRNVVSLASALLFSQAAACDFFLDGKRPYRPDASVTLSTMGEPPYPLSEAGEIQGMPYTLDYSDGHFAIGGFVTNCGIDAMRDYRWCQVQSDDLRIVKAKGFTPTVYVGDDHYPGTTVELRIDSGPVHSAKPPGWSGEQAKALISKLKSGKAIRTRFTRWPYEAPLDGTFQLAGISAALKYADFAISRPYSCPK